ncbi:MAG: 5-(carboxyamino)imidazole ribonucleotide mutase [Candidatus Rokubacteria bacterium RIFCSPLOWO2_02_FULL_68_19]|nr:MAG: 5-(carboxyamino)imidazole ribonucleotide mutase [Candidatus Rokubacteria bacterium RIFCSPLOWO2_02_FULL_68_19]
MARGRPLVGIVMGSDSDLEVLRETIKVLDDLEIPHEVVVASAHRTPEQTRRYATRAERRGIRVLIAGAGGAAALPGFLASLTSLPIIGVPINSSPLNGLDALLSIAQMPKGVPVATVAVGKWGAANAGILAAQILALSDAKVRKRLAAFRKAMAAEVQQRSRRVAAQLKKRQ